MPKLELKLDNVHNYGFPYACMMCGSDENPTPRSKKFQREDGLLGCGCAMLFGPIGWLVALLYFLVKSGSRSHKFPVPVCDCCEQARVKIRNRDIAIMILGLAVLLTPLSVASLATSPLPIWGGLLLLLTAGLDQAIYRGQFNFRTVKTEADRVVIDIPNDDYPSLYQRHLDTAVLYGSVEQLGTEVTE